MKTRFFTQTARWLNLPTGVLIALLQRSPALKVVCAVGEYVLSSPIGTVLRGVVTTAASLGAVQTLAGATQLSATSASPLSVTVGSSVNVGFTITGAQTPAGSFTVSGSLPPGTAIYPSSTGGTGATSGVVNADANGAVYLRGSPTTAGSYVIGLRGWQNPGGSGDQSTVFNYTVNVTGATTNTPTITTDPVSQTVAPGGSVTFTVAATGSNLTYQWKKNDTAIAGATNATLTLTNLQGSNAGDYTATVTNAGGSTTSMPATLIVDNPVRGRLMNLSVLNRAGAGSPLVAGFILSGGSGTKDVVARGTGPSLAGFNVSGYLPDPKLELQPTGGGAVLASNDSWQQAPNLTAIQATGLQLFGGVQLNAKDALILQALPLNGGSAGYTATVSDASAGSGSCLVEIFDVDSTAPGSPGFDQQGRLSNLSALAQISTGGTLTAGFIINGTAPIRLVIRATGPTLQAGYGVGGVLPDPKLKLQRQGGPVFAQNDSWGAATNVAEITAGGWNKLGTTTLDQKDAVIVVTVAPGAYTAIVSDANNAGGTTLVEVFEWP